MTPLIRQDVRQRRDGYASGCRRAATFASTATLPLGVDYLGLGRLTARFSETSTKPFASNIKANLTLVTFAECSFI